MHAGRISWKKWSDADFDWYVLCTKLCGWIELARITFLANETNTEKEGQLILIAVHFLWVSVLLFWHHWPVRLSYCCYRAM